MALAQGDDINDVYVDFAGHRVQQSDRYWGFAQSGNEPGQFNGGEDISRHGIFSTWFSEMHTRAYDIASVVGNVQPDSNGDCWYPPTGTGLSSAFGQVKNFHVEAVEAFTFVR